MHFEQPYMRAPARYCLYRMPMVAVVWGRRGEVEGGEEIERPEVSSSWHLGNVSERAK